MTREIRLDIEVPGTPEEVWDTIATGHGITCWFVPTELDERLGGAIKHYFTPDASEAGRVIAWDPPHRFAYEGAEQGGRRLAYEWTVESVGGGKCIVRLVNSGFLSGADWDAEFEGLSQGWPVFLFNLRLCRTYFPAERCSSSIVNATAPGPRAAAWANLSHALGLPTSSQVGDRVRATADDAPPLGGVVERFQNEMLCLRIDDPVRGIALIGAEGDGDSVALSVYIYAYGEHAPDVIARDSPRWRTWLGARYQPWPVSTPIAPG